MAQEHRQRAHSETQCRSIELQEKAVRFDAPARPTWELTEAELRLVAGGNVTQNPPIYPN